MGAGYDDDGMAVQSKVEQRDLVEVKAAFSRRYLDRSRGIYSVGIGREDGEYCLRVSGHEQALKRLPDRFRGTRVLGRVGAPGVVGLAGR